jgi:hypothetical protein
MTDKELVLSHGTYRLVGIPDSLQPGRNAPGHLRHARLATYERAGGDHPPAVIRFVQGATENEREVLLLAAARGHVGRIRQLMARHHAAEWDISGIRSYLVSLAAKEADYLLVGLEDEDEAGSLDERIRAGIAEAVGVEDTYRKARAFERVLGFPVELDTGFLPVIEKVSHDLMASAIALDADIMAAEAMLAEQANGSATVRRIAVAAAGQARTGGPQPLRP